MTILSSSQKDSRKDAPSVPLCDVSRGHSPNHLDAHDQRNVSGSAAEWLVCQARSRGRLTPQDEVALAERRLEAEKALALAQRALQEYGGSPESPITQRLLERISQYEAVRDEVIATFMERNLLFAIRVANDFNFLPTSLDSRISSALEGIREAASRFDPEKGAKFSSYAAMWIQQRIYKDCRVEGREIRLPTGMWKELVRLQEAEDDLKTSLGREPSRAELTKRLGITPQRLQCLLQARQTSTTSLDAPVRDGEEATFADLIHDTTASVPGTAVATPDQLALLSRVFPTLSAREQRVLRGRFGFDTDGVPETLEAIGEREGVTRERIRQIESEALSKLRRRYAQADCPPIFGLS